MQQSHYFRIVLHGKYSILVPFGEHNDWIYIFIINVLVKLGARHKIRYLDGGGGN